MQSSKLQIKIKNFWNFKFLTSNFNFSLLTFNFQSKTLGFTLVELLVVISIAALIGTVGYSSFRDFETRQKLSGAAGQVKADLALVQQKALSGEKPSGCSGILNGWKVSFSANSYSFIADCGALGSAGDVAERTIKLPPGITASSGSVTFKVLARGTVEGTNQTFTFTQNSTGKTATVTVDAGGGIY